MNGWTVWYSNDQNKHKYRAMISCKKKEIIIIIKRNNMMYIYDEESRALCNNIVISLNIDLNADS